MKTIRENFTVIQWSPLNGIALGKAIFDNNDQNILLFKLPFPLNEASFMQRDLLKLPPYKIVPLITLSVISLDNNCKVRH
jgi:hypothetical protein